MDDFSDCGGLGLALLESKLSSDGQAFNMLTENAPANQIVWSATLLAALIAQRAAIGLTIIDTGEQVSDDPDNGVWRVLSVAVVAESMMPDHEIINAVSHVYRARDRFLTSMRDSFADSAPDEHGNIDVFVTFWEGWEEDRPEEVIMGVGLALERLFMFDMAAATNGTAEDFEAASDATLAAYHRHVASGLL